MSVTGSQPLAAVQPSAEQQLSVHLLLPDARGRERHLKRQHRPRARTLLDIAENAAGGLVPHLVPGCAHHQLLAHDRHTDEQATPYEKPRGFLPALRRAALRSAIMAPNTGLEHAVWWRGKSQCGHNEGKQVRTCAVHLSDLSLQL